MSNVVNFSQFHKEEKDSAFLKAQINESLKRFYDEKFLEYPENKKNLLILFNKQTSIKSYDAFIELIKKIIVYYIKFWNISSKAKNGEIPVDDFKQYRKFYDRIKNNISIPFCGIITGKDTQSYIFDAYEKLGTEDFDRIIKYIMETGEDILNI
ncbi:MAG: hypothetical protein PHF46_00880 [Candidatus Gracilibacteria bacterium]|nr:hypothetical protein [Candidatus Gracilibacteria bacterium]MDD3119946.1 hypothetical protein [Candidatus Gracilibacteria bacterium]MDD4530165.1 hypothetical protein [Candidatus Gracilibacteria bacterium]